MLTTLEYMARGNRRKTFAQVRAYTGLKAVSQGVSQFNYVVDITVACKCLYMHAHLGYKLLPNHVYPDGCELIFVRTIDRN